MPMYVYHCKRCDLTFEELCDIKDRKSIKCPECKKKAQQQITNCRDVIFKELKGTSKEDNMEYVFKHNYENAQNLRRIAEKKQGPSPYKPIDDSQWEGKIS